MKTKFFLNLGRSAGIVLGVGYALSASAANPVYTDISDIPLTNNVFSVATADLMGNGKQDIISADGTVLLNTSPGDGSTSFTPGPSVPAAYWVTTADINGDGKPDLIEVDQSNQVSVYLNTTQPGDSVPSFAAPVYFNSNYGITMVVAADVNGDGIPDLVMVDTAINGVDVLINTTVQGSSDVTFSNFQAFQAGNQVNWLAVGDLNGDGLQDIVAVNNMDNTISVFMNTTGVNGTTPSFALQQVFSVGNFPNSVAIVDVNGDNSPDIVVSSLGENFVSVLLNTTPNGSPTASLAPEQLFATGTTGTAVIAADMNGDGKPDLIVANSDDATMSVLFNTTATGASTASFAPQVLGSTGNDPVDMVAADLNGDGSLDLVVMDAAQFAAWPSVSLLVDTSASESAMSMVELASGSTEASSALTCKLGQDSMARHGTHGTHGTTRAPVKSSGCNVKSAPVHGTKKTSLLPGGTVALGTKTH